MTRETQFGLLVVVALTAVFGVLVAKRLHQPFNLQAEAQSDGTPAAGSPPETGSPETAGDRDSAATTAVDPFSIPAKSPEATASHDGQGDGAGDRHGFDPDPLGTPSSTSIPRRRSTADSRAIDNSRDSDSVDGFASAATTSQASRGTSVAGARSATPIPADLDDSTALNPNAATTLADDQRVDSRGSASQGRISPTVQSAQTAAALSTPETDPFASDPLQAEAMDSTDGSSEFEAADTGFAAAFPATTSSPVASKSAATFSAAPETGRVTTSTATDEGFSSATAEADPFESPSVEVTPDVEAIPDAAAEPDPFKAEPNGTAAAMAVDDVATSAPSTASDSMASEVNTPELASGTIDSTAAENDPFGFAPTSSNAATSSDAETSSNVSTSQPLSSEPELGFEESSPATSRVPAVRPPSAPVVTSSADDPFTSTPQASPIGGGSQKRVVKTPSPAAAVDPIAESNREGADYVVRDSENFWSISQRRYGTGRYYAALAKHNESVVADPKKLRAGMTIDTPSADILESRYASLIPAGSNPTAISTAAPEDAPPVAGELLVSDTGEPMYRVGKEDTLTSIARENLGRSSRWVQIFAMNRDILKDSNTLAIGTVLRLPADAALVRSTSTKPAGR
jgi:nucleoid-associated protein YgaU